MITGEQVKAARKLLGWSQEVLAGHVGVSDVAIGNIERGCRAAAERKCRLQYGLLQRMRFGASSDEIAIFDVSRS
jgi:transcriptional regulator with XRE-family HTH domain